MDKNNDVRSFNREAWDRQVDSGKNPWTVPVSSELIARARKADWSVVLTLEFERSDMADKAALMPHAKRTVGRCVEYVADDMITIYLAFPTLLALARQV